MLTCNPLEQSLQAFAMASPAFFLASHMHAAPTLGHQSHMAQCYEMQFAL